MIHNLRQKFDHRHTIIPFVGFRRGRGGGDCGFIINHQAASRARSWRRLRRGDGCPAEVARHFGLFCGPVAAANAALANDAVARPILVKEERTDGSNCPAGTRPRSRRSRPPKAECSGAGSRPRRHGDHCAQALPGLRPLWRCRCRSRRVTARTARHGGYGRSRRARREPWGLSPPGARGRADLPGDRAAAGGRGPPIPIPF